MSVIDGNMVTTDPTPVINYRYPTWLHPYKANAITRAVQDALLFLVQRPLNIDLAVIFDIDDTLLYSMNHGPIHPVRSLYQYILTLVPTVTIFLITARNPTYRVKTERQLRVYGMDGWKELIMVGNQPSIEEQRTYRQRYVRMLHPHRVVYNVDPDGKGERKALARQQIEQQGYTIWLNIGDDPTDHLNGHYVHAIKLPE